MIIALKVIISLGIAMIWYKLTSNQDVAIFFFVLMLVIFFYSSYCLPKSDRATGIFGEI